MLIAILVILILIIAILSILLAIKFKKDTKTQIMTSLQDVLDERGFYSSEICYVNSSLAIALNKNNSKIAIIKNFNPNNAFNYDYDELATAFIDTIEKGVNIKINYTKMGEHQTLSIYPINNDIKNFLYKIFKTACVNKIESKFHQENFILNTGSDWECSYIWAFNPKINSFGYFKTGEKSTIFKINLLKEHFTIDTKYKYFEAPIYGIQQQLMTYEKNFLGELFDYVLNSIKIKCNVIANNLIYFDSFNNIVYLTNGLNSLQSVIFNKIDEVYYRDNRISFSLANEDKVINFIANSQLINAFEEFMTTYNLKKIAQNFDNKTDKVINATPYTKFIIDSTRDRVIYCANLNKLSSFSYIIISFNELHNIQTEKSGSKHFVRLTTKNKEIIDVTCDKKEIAQYIEAQILKLISE
mgnify:CR=1 FL=1